MGTQVICFANNKGGSGKSTTCANVGYGLTQLGKKVLLIDGDMQLNLSLSFFSDDEVLEYAQGEANLYHAIRNQKDLKDFIIHTPYENLDMIPSSTLMSSIEYELFTKWQREFILKRCLANVVEFGEYDYILIDCPAGIGHGFKNAIAGADSAIIVTTPEISSLRDADRIKGILENEGIINKKLIINRIRPDMIKKRKMMSPEDIVDILEIELLGLIYDDESVIISSDKGEPLSDYNSYAGQAYKNITERLCGNNVEFMKLYNTDSKLIRFFSRLSGNRRDCV